MQREGAQSPSAVAGCVAPPDEPQRAKQQFKTTNYIDMKKFEKIALTFCYLFTLVSVVRMCFALVQDLEAITFASVATLVVVFLGLGSLMLVAGVLLFSDRK